MRVGWIAAALAVVAAGVIPIGASAEEPSCERTLLDVPVETTHLPEGYVWDQLVVSASSWSGTVHATDPEVEYPPSVSFTLGCAEDPAALLARATEVSQALVPGGVVDIEPFADASVALRDLAGVVTVSWAHGPFVGSIRPWGVRVDGFDASELVKVATAVDATIGAALDD
jgi:hypothetical protein